MRLILIRPNSSMVVTSPPIGLGYLAHAVKNGRGDHVSILDARKLRLCETDIIQRIQEFGPDAVGVTAMTYESPEAASLISKVKNKWPHIPVIMGGPHVVASGPPLMEDVKADYLVIGEGEQTLVELLSKIENGHDLAEVKGLVWREGEQIVFNGPRPPIEDMEQLVIDWELIGPENYFGLWTRNAMNTIACSGRRLPVFTSRGCPFGCAYCHQIFGRKYRSFDIEKTVREMVRLRDTYKVNEFEIIDDNFNVNLDRAKEFMREIVSCNLGCSITFTNGLRADQMDEELLDLMVKAGTYRIDYAIESASDRIQQMVHKNLDLNRAREVVNMTAEKGIVTGTYNILGFPGETEDEMVSTIEYALSLKNHIASFFYLMPFPGTELVDSDPVVKEKVRNMNFRDASGIVLNLSAVSDDTLKRLRRKGYREFYFSGSRIVRILRDVPFNARLLASAVAALKLSFKESVNY